MHRRSCLHAGDERSNQPIHWAAMTRQLDVIDELLQIAARISTRRRFDGAHPIQLANGDYYFRGWRDVPKRLADEAADVIAHLARSRRVLRYLHGVPHRRFGRVRELLDEDPSLANRVADYTTYYLGSGSPLKNAAANGHLEIVQLLLDRGADPNLREEGIAPLGHALYAAAANRHYEIANLLLRTGPIPNPPVESSADALSRAIIEFRPADDRPAVLVRCGAGRWNCWHADGDRGNRRGRARSQSGLADDPVRSPTPPGRQEAFVRLMLRYQPDLPKQVIFPGWLTAAKTPELNELLFAHGMNASQRDWLGVTPLHQFARKGEVDSAEQFIDHGADLHARDEDICSTPLGWAAKFGQKAMVELLLRRGASPNLADDPPWATPLAWATRRGHGEIAELLKQHGAT